MAVLLFIIAVVFVLAYSFAYHWAPRRWLSFLIPLLIASLLYILGFIAWILIGPLDPSWQLVALVVLAVIILYGGRRFWGRLDKRPNP
jgi:hypothetical protein